MKPKPRVKMVMAVTAVALALAGSAALAGHRQDSRPRPTVITTHADRSGGGVGKRRRMTAGTLCETVAPKALREYLSDSPGRGKSLDRYFTDDAEGLDIPVSDLLAQPSGQFSGALASGDARDAACSVWTGLKSPWHLDFSNTRKGWRATAVEGPAVGAYKGSEGGTDADHQSAP